MNNDDVKKGLNAPIPIHFHIGDPEPRMTPLAVHDLESLHAKTLANIQRLENHNDELSKEIERLQMEKDAAVEDIRMLLTSYKGACKTCIHGKDQDDCDVGVGCEYCQDEKCPCKTCKNGYCNWQWRGVQQEE